MKNLQNSTLKTNWPMVGTLTKDAYLCPKFNEMNKETLYDDEETTLKPYTMEEIETMLDESERDFEAGRVYTTEEVLKMCMEGVSL